MRIDPRYGQSDLHERFLLIVRTLSPNRRRSAVSTGCADSHSSLSIASNVPSNSAFAAEKAESIQRTFIPSPDGNVTLLPGFRDQISSFCVSTCLLRNET